VSTPLREMDLEGTVTVEGESFALARMSSVEDNGLINAGMTTTPFLVVALNDAAWALPEHLRLAIIGHEVGHYFLGHRPEAVGGRNLLDEIEADMFSVQIAGLPAVRQLLKTMRKTCLRHGVCPQEADVRLAALPVCPKMERRIPGKRRKRNRK
jgi:hypothetical protein